MVDIVSQLVMVETGQIKPYERNARRNETTILKLMELIPKVGFNVPLLLDRQNVIIKGHSRFEAAVRLGLPALPCVYSNADEDTIKLDRLADNKVQELSSWDEDLLRSELASITTDFDLASLDFELSQTIGAWPADKVQRRPVAELIPYALNARLHSPEQITQIANSIKEFGFTIPVLVDEAGVLIAGHGRVSASKELGLVTIPVMTARGWTEEQIRAYRISDNQLALNGAWDEELLKVELSDLQAGGYDLEGIGFSVPELEGILADRGGLTDPDEAPEPPAEPVTRLGDVWLLGGHRLVCGDSTDAATVARALDGAKPHLMVTDPPYGVSFMRGKFVGRDKAAKGKVFAPIANDHLRGDGLVNLIAKVLTAWGAGDGSVAYLWAPSLKEGFAIFQGIEEAGFRVQSQLIWNKTPFVIGRADYHWKHEVCWYALKGGGRHPWYGGRDKATVWDIPKQLRMEDHPTTKPVECMKRPIENNSQAGDAVYDPFLGSGTTIIAGQMTGRSVLAIELSPAYCDVSVLRWQSFTGLAATLEATRETYDEKASRSREALVV